MKNNTEERPEDVDSSNDKDEDELNINDSNELSPDSDDWHLCHL